MRIRSALLAATLLAAPLSAHATAYEAAGFTWSGMYVGILAGYGTGTSDWDFNGSGSANMDIDSGLVGGRIGYNAQLSNGLVAGVELSSAGTNIGGKSACSGNTCSVGIKSLSDLSGRLGVNYGHTLLYGKGGVAYETSEHSIAAPGSFIKDSGGSLGYVFGGGLEMYIDNNITSNLEYNYYRFNSDSVSLGATHIDDDLAVSVFKLGFNLKFN